MAVTMERLEPYVAQLLENDDVRDNFVRMTANLRQAQSRASSRKSKRQAVKDRHLQQRLLETARAAGALAVAVREEPGAPALERRRSRRRKLALVLAGAGAGGYLAYDADARRRVMELAGK